MAISKEAEAKKMKDWKLTFSTRHIIKGLNVTFRDGNDKYLEMMPGDTILMVDRVGGVIGNARVLAPIVLRKIMWKNQIEYLLQWDPDPKCRTYEAWVDRMDDVYGKGWGPIVTAILYWVD